MSSYEKPDFWSLKAQKEGYPARSVYKLKEIDEKFKLFKPLAGLKVLDLGAAPGSWSLYVLRAYANKQPPSRALKGRCSAATTPATTGIAPVFLAAADLLPLSRQYDGGLFSRKDFFFIQGDFTTEPVRNELVLRGPYTALICDAAPNTTGTRTVDTLRSLALAEETLSITKTCLSPGGNMALKVFQGGDTADLLKQMRECFNSVKSFKPACCRKDSFETYFIGLGKKDIVTL